MGVPMTHVCLLVALCAFLSSSAPVSNSLVVSVRTPVSVGSGHTTTLPCWLSPPQSAEGLEVRWYLGDHFDAPIVLYQVKKLEVASKEPSYVGRVAFGLKDATSGGLKTGDVSLELSNVTIKDTGDYTCYVSSDQGYDRSIVSLTVTETGATPLLSVVWKDNMVNVSCGSEGWYPKPQLRWSHQKQDLTPKGLDYSTDVSGLLSVHSWIFVPDSSEVSCSVGLSDEKAKEARVRLESPPQPSKQESGSSAAGWVAFALLLIAVLVLVSLGVLYFKKKAPFLGKRDKSGSDQADGDQADEKRQLLPKDVVQPTDLTTCIKHYVNVKLEETQNQYLKIKDGKLRDASVQFPDGQRVTGRTAIKGTPGFSSGQHYWEVSLGKAGLDLKQSWWVGVTNAAVNLHKCDLPLTASKGFWFLSSSPDRAESFQFSTEPNVSLPFSSRLQTIGVFLNYDSGELSFYNVEDKSLIGSTTASFTGEVFPFFNPGIGDKVPMEILQRTVESQFSDKTNCADVTLQEAE